MFVSGTFLNGACLRPFRRKIGEKGERRTQARGEVLAGRTPYCLGGYLWLGVSFTDQQLAEALDGEHGARRRPHHRFGHAAQEKALQARAAVGGLHDQVGAVALGRVENGGGRRSTAHLRGGFHAMSAHVSAAACRSPSTPASMSGVASGTAVLAKS